MDKLNEFRGVFPPDDSAPRMPSSYSLVKTHGLISLNPSYLVLLRGCTRI